MSTMSKAIWLLAIHLILCFCHVIIAKINKKKSKKVYNVCTALALMYAIAAALVISRHFIPLL